MSRNLPLILVGVLAVCAVWASNLLSDERQSGTDTRIDDTGITTGGN